MRRDDAHDSGDLGGPQLFGHVDAIEEKAPILEVDVHAAQRVENVICMGRIPPAAERHQGRQPVVGAGVEIGDAEYRGDRTRHSALTHSAGTVYRDDHMASRAESKPGHDTPTESKPCISTGVPGDAATAAAMAMR